MEANGYAEHSRGFILGSIVDIIGMASESKLNNDFVTYDGEVSSFNVFTCK